MIAPRSSVFASRKLYATIEETQFAVYSKVCCNVRQVPCHSTSSPYLQPSSANHRRLRLLWLLGLLLLSGCLRRQEETVTAALPLDENLPTAWSPLGDVQPVNIDGDAPTEYLLFFTYGGESGPVGAVIYNTETITGTATGDDAGSRLSTSFQPYSILPSYRPGTGQGFIAAFSQRTALQVRAVSRQNPTEATAEQSTPTYGPLAILGGATYLTWVWWQPGPKSYGVTQLYAADHFEAALYQPYNWESWLAAPTLIQDLTAVYPLHERSQLCRRKRYLLTTPADTPDFTTPLAGIAYREYDLGLNFCNGIPTAPFYPEAVVLAYLLNGDSSLWDAELPESRINELTDLVDQNMILRVDDLAGYTTIPGTEQGSTARPVLTTACAQVVLPAASADPAAPTVALPDLLPADGDTANGEATARYSRRRLLFTLRHQPPQRELGTTDQLYLTNVEVLPAPAEGSGVDCRERLTG
jgi:hypothetical protein